VLLAVSLVVVAVTMLNPYGVDTLRAPLMTLGNHAITQFIVEWRPPDFHDVRFVPYLLLWLALLVAFAFARRRPHATDLLIVAGLGYLSLVSVRNISLFAIAAAPLITHQAARILPVVAPWRVQPSLKTAALNVVLALATLIAAVVQIGTVLSRSEQSLALVYPTQAANFIEQAQPVGPLLNSYNFGGYLIWRLYPDYKVFIDGRAEFIYDDAFIGEYYVRVWQARGNWQDFLDRFHINLIVIEHDGALAPLLRASQQWRLLHEDALAVVFERVP
ncbi:MAG: hypothetical protein LC737_09920, partial [Chloroflexi bacterium]|nr:hypothetical protein [Chloroflexota bacterium]